MSDGLVFQIIDADSVALWEQNITYIAHTVDGCLDCI